jgi:hypothetical protein
MISSSVMFYMLLIGCAAVCKDGMPALPFIGKRELSVPWF